MTRQNQPWALSRRQILKAGSAGTVAVVFQKALAIDALAQTPEGTGGAAFFSRDDERTLASVVERIWPATDTPGAREIGVVEYIGRALGGPYSDDEPQYKHGLRRLNDAAESLHGATFRLLSEEQQDDVLARMEADDLDNFEGESGSEFFSMLHEHTMEGVFADPIWGGNRDFAGWRTVGYPGPFYIISAERQQSFEPLDMPYHSIVDL